MNYCRKCQSDYEKPGTCNCYAEVEAGKKIDPVIVPMPYYQPWWVGPFPWSGTTTTSPTCSVCGKSNCTEMHITCWNGSALASNYTGLAWSSGGGNY